jgi:hypothetical protein
MLTMSMQYLPCNDDDDLPAAFLYKGHTRTTMECVIECQVDHNGTYLPARHLSLPPAPAALQQLWPPWWVAHSLQLLPSQLQQLQVPAVASVQASSSSCV